MGAREDITRAILAGNEAAKNGHPPTTCPHPRTSVLRAAWIRGYANVRPATAPDE